MLFSNTENVLKLKSNVIKLFDSDIREKTVLPMLHHGIILFYGV